jgi:hypothetical protein
MPISEQQFLESAQLLNVPVAAIKAVAEVESAGAGFLSTGEPKILFEPHIWWKELRRAGLDPAQILAANPDISDILYQKWGSKPYGGIMVQHKRLARAVDVNRETALMSASYGKFQICGFNWQLCGCRDLQEFINKMYRDEDAQLELFCNYIKRTHLDDELREGDWAAFALAYNGPSYRKNAYDTKLRMANARYS